MNPFIQAAKELIYPNGIIITYQSVSDGTYDVETGLTSNTSTDTVITAFPKVLKPSLYSYPSLVGKTVSEWLVVAPDLPSNPKPLDKILKGTEVHTVESYSEHVAQGELVLYKVVASKG